MRRPLFILATSVVLLSSACGDDGDSASETASEIEQTVSETASEAEGAAGEAASEASEAASEVASEVEDATGTQVDEEEIAQQADELVADLRERGLSNVASFIEAVGLENVVEDTSFTLLAPTDDAFLTLDRDVLSGLLSDPQGGVRILQDHLLDERVDSTELASMSQVTTSSGSELPVVAEGGTVTIGDATVTEADIEVGGGVVHVIDTVITTGS